MRQKIAVTKLLDSVTEVCYKMRQVLQSVAESIKKYVTYYKLRQTIITNYARY